jgi:lysophospholipase L1-like esterase
VTALPKVLLLGDSIRMSYQLHVAAFLEGTACVTGPAENCQYSLYTLESLDRWVAELGRPDVIHWNNGIHDCGHNPDRTPVQFPLEDYLANLRAILPRLRALTPRVIWATSTPVHPTRPFTEECWSWRNDEIDAYNAAATALMRRKRVPINDLHALVWQNVTAYLAEDRLHLSEGGQVACARAVAEAVTAQL